MMMMLVLLRWHDNHIDTNKYDENVDDVKKMIIMMIKSLNTVQYIGNPMHMAWWPSSQLWLRGLKSTALM